MPSVALAVWWNPTTWFKSDDSQNIQPAEQAQPQSPIKLIDTSESDISSLQSQIISLNEKMALVEKYLATANNNLASCQANLAIKNKTTGAPVQSTPPVIPKPTTTSTQITQKSGSFRYSSVDNIPYKYDTYSKVSIFDYSINPPMFDGWGVEISPAIVSDFIPKGNRGFTNNYFEITDSAGKKMMVEVDDANGYATVVNDLKIGSKVVVSGVGIPTQKFNPPAGSINSDPTYEPVVFAQQILTSVGNFGDMSGYVWSIKKP